MRSQPGSVEPGDGLNLARSCEPIPVLSGLLRPAYTPAAARCRVSGRSAKRNGSSRSRFSLLTFVGHSLLDHGHQRLVPARPLWHARNPRRQPPPRRPSRPRLRRPRRLRHERNRRHPCLPVGTEPGTCGQGSKKDTIYATGSACPGGRTSRVYERRLRNSARR
jgi:hypothetical protein